MLNLFMDLRRELELAYLFISHDGVVEHVSDRVVIMYLGRGRDRPDAGFIPAPSTPIRAPC